MSNKLSAVVIARDEAEMLPACLSRLTFADEIVVVVDSRTIDDTADIATSFGASTHVLEFTGFAAFKNKAVELAAGDWVLVVDADERVSKALADEVRQRIELDEADAYRVVRWNYVIGQRIRFGGWLTNPGIRLARKGLCFFPPKRVHEGMRVDPSARVSVLSEPLHHFTRRSILENARKTAYYADLQAHDWLEAGHPPVTSILLLRKVGHQLLARLVRRGGWRDGFVGVSQGLESAFGLVVTYARLWELQQRPSIEERYAELEETTR